jgi:hypothetical protein
MAHAGVARRSVAGCFARRCIVPNRINIARGWGAMTSMASIVVLALASAAVLVLAC